MQLEKIDPQFRIITDQLFFTDRMDLDLSNYLDLLNSNEEHLPYLWDRLHRSMEIFWEASFWENRFDFLLTLNHPKKITEALDSYLISHFRHLITSQLNANPKHDNVYQQTIAWIKAKLLHKEDLKLISNLLLEMPYFVSAHRVFPIVNNFIPYLFADINEYVAIISKQIGQSARSFEVLRHLEGQGLPIDKAPMFKLVDNLLFKRTPNRKNRRAFFMLISDPPVMSHLKDNYKPENRDRLLELISRCDYQELEEQHLRNLKSLLELDESIADDLINVYADRLYSRGTGHKKANIMRLIRACKTYSQFSPKKILVYLSVNNKMSDVKYLLSAFPDLKTLALFV